MHSRTILVLFAALFVSPVVAQAKAGTQPRTTRKDPIHSRIEQTSHGYTLVQEALIAAPIEKVWAAFTTAEGWAAWAAPLAAVDLRPGGSIRTHYDPKAKLGDEGTNVLSILNYVEHRVLTLQAKESKAWPEVMRKDAAHLMNVIVFEDLGKGGTRVYSYGVGYGKDKAYENMLKFFDSANQKLYRQLIAYLEKDERAK